MCRKRNFIFGSIALVALGVIAFSCATVNQIFGSPQLAVSGVSIKSLDLEGITFNMDYSISNPYPVGFSIKSVAADVMYDTTKFTSLSADEGVKVASGGTQKNALSFKIPYETIISMAKNGISGKTALPFSISGNAALDLSAVSFLENQSLTIPFTKSFDVPVFKPSLSVSNVALQKPTLTELKDAFIGGGMGATKALSVATAIISGNSVVDTIFDGVNLDMNLNFDVNVGSEGSAPWKYVLEKCSLQTASGALANVTAQGTNTISSNGTIPITAKLNTMQAGKFIAQLLNKSGTNPVFTIDSGLSFTDLPSYAQNLPLSYSKEIPLSSITTKK